jgi:hypothetical protein
MGRKVVGLSKPRKLSKPLKSTLASVRERCEEVFHQQPPDEVVFEMALSEDQEIENWKAGLIVALDESPKERQKSSAKKVLGSARKPDRRVKSTKAKTTTPATRKRR